MTLQVCLVPGDGIGSEICEAVKLILKKVLSIAWHESAAGLVAFEKFGDAVPAETIAKIVDLKIALKGPTTTPSGSGHQSANVSLRKNLDLYANVRPIKSLPNLNTPYTNLDLLIVRENTEDTYAGIEYMLSPKVACGYKMMTWAACERIARFSFQIARDWKRKKVTCVHKANIHKLTDGMFLNAHEAVAKEFSDIAFDSIIVDNLCMQLVTKPHQFDLLSLPNLYGDIVSDLCAGLVGGLGVAPGANIGDNCAVFEAVHGSAPDIAGKNLANPTALLLSACMMLRHAKYLQEADKIEKAIIETFKDKNSMTRDLGGKASTSEFTNALLSKLS